MKSNTRNASNKRADKFSISLPDDMAAWLRRHSAKRKASVSAVIKDALLPMFEARHAK